MSNNNFAGISFGYDADKIFKERDDTMCSQFKENFVRFSDTDLNVRNNAYGNYIVHGETSETHQFVKFWAANPPTYSLSYAGSGLPYQNPEMAFENTPNQGVAKVVNGKFQFALEYPNSYYIDMGKTLIPPQLKFVYCDASGKDVGNVHTLNLGNGIPFRTDTWTPKRDWNKGPMFFCNNNLPVRTQYQILLDSAYPSVNQEPSNFWGLKPTP